MKCKLCQQDLPLLKNSHIVPDFMYQDLYDEKHRIMKAKLKDVTARPIQTGEKESDILCQNCDNVILGSLEKYASDVLYGGRLPNHSFRNEMNQNGVKYVSCTGLDYKKFKLFFMSVLWRFSISNKDFFEKINLGSYEEKLRQMILSGDPGKQMDFPCLINSYKSETDLPHQVISQPLPSKGQDGKTMVSILIGGMWYMFAVALDFDSDWMAEAVINEQGEMKMIHMPRDSAERLLSKSFGLRV